MSNIKKKRVSKKNKIAWRKHVDITDVENFLEDKRLDERLGKHVSEKTDTELFHIDTGGNRKAISISKKERRQLLKEKPLKCFSMLQSHTEVSDPLIKRNRVHTKEERKNKLVKLKEKERNKQGIFKKKELQSHRDRKIHEVRKSKKLKKDIFSEDIWHCEGNKDILNQWIEEDTKKHILQSTKKLPKVVPKGIYRKQSVLHSIEIPHPGTSYNPSIEDHQSLLQEVIEKESKIIKEENHLNRVTKGMFNKVTRNEMDKNWLKEMLQGLETDQNSKYSDEESNGDILSVNPPVKNKKKSTKQRRKQKEQQQLEHSKLMAKSEKKKVADIYKLRFLKLQIEKLQKKEDLTKLKRLKRKALDEKKTKRLSIRKFEEQEIDFNEPKDLYGNLRNIKKEGSLLVDRFKSLQKRNILQPTTVQTHKRAKIKRFTKPGHKSDWKITVARPNNQH